MVIKPNYRFSISFSGAAGKESRTKARAHAQTLKQQIWHTQVALMVMVVVLVAASAIAWKKVAHT